MGTAKDNMTPTVVKPEEKPSIFGKLPGRKKAEPVPAPTVAENYADKVLKAVELLKELRALKEGDFANEPNCKKASELKLANLDTQLFHLDSTVDLMHEYVSIK